MLRVCFRLKFICRVVLAAMVFALSTAPIAPNRALAQTTAINYDALWAAQPSLLAKATANLPTRSAGNRRIFAVSIAAGGSQAIFGREAEAMRDLYVQRLGKGSTGLLLSNAYAHQARVPLANRDNVTRVLSAIGKRFNPSSDMAVIYLTAHGSPDAALQTDLPDAFGLKRIDASFLAEALDKAGISRRIVVISACFSGSWIGKLASPDTIVLTAASATRTSFGCDDRLQFTYFGAAWLAGPLREGASWRAAFDRLQADIGAQESLMGVLPSQPTASVGKRMEAVWNAPLGPARTH